MKKILPTAAAVTACLAAVSAAAAAVLHIRETWYC